MKSEFDLHQTHRCAQILYILTTKYLGREIAQSNILINFATKSTSAVRALHSLIDAGIEAQEKSDKLWRFINDHLGREIDQRHDFVNFATKPNSNLKTQKKIKPQRPPCQS